MCISKQAMKYVQKYGFKMGIDRSDQKGMKISWEWPIQNWFRKVGLECYVQKSRPWVQNEISHQNDNLSFSSEIELRGDVTVSERGTIR